MSGFVYMWMDIGHIEGPKYYIGSHKGRENDRYISSSKRMNAVFKKRPQLCSRVILYRGLDYRAEEQKWLDHWCVVGNPDFYNFKGRAVGGSGPRSKETIEKTIASQKKVFADPAYRKRHSEILKKALSDPDVRKQKTESQIKRWSDPDRRKKQSEALTKSWSDPARREQQSEALKKACANPVLAQERSDITKAQWADPTIRKNRVEGLKKAAASPSTRLKRITAQKKYWEDPEKRKKMSETIKEIRRLRKLRDSGSEITAVLAETP